MKIKIHGGTVRHDEEPLCRSCRYATIALGSSSKEQIIECGRLETRITFPVRSCTRYLHANQPTLYDMEDMAWILRTDRTTKQIGFVRSKDLKIRERHLFDDDVW